MRMKEQSESSYRHVLKYTSLFGSVQGLNILITLIRSKAMALLVGAGGMGLSSLMTSMQSFASQITNLGISFGAVPRLSEYYEQQNRHRLEYYIMVIRLWSVIAAVLGLVFCLVVSTYADQWSFTWGDHSLHYAMLGFSVAMLALTGGETAILKAARQLGSLARIQVFTAVASAVISIPLYYFLFHSGIVPAILLSTFAVMVATMWYSYRLYPPKLIFRKSILSDGAGMIRLGLAFVLAAAIGSASEMFIRSFLNVEGSLEDVGMYNVGYMIAITYASIVFSSMESDYFPRLSAVSKDIAASNEMVNKQKEVSLLLLSPMLVALLMFLPILVPMLFSHEFLPVVDMAQVAVLAMYFKALTMPVSYITLARSRSLAYLFLETSYFLALVVSVIMGYRWWGITGTGVAIVVAHMAEYVLTLGYAYWQYGYRPTLQICRYAVAQLLLGVLAYVVSLLLGGWKYWITEAALAIASTAYSVYILRQKTRLWEALMRKLKSPRT
jgi:O-antigen/teichoic acid export membrane protein